MNNTVKIALFLVIIFVVGYLVSDQQTKNNEDVIQNDISEKSNSELVIMNTKKSIKDSPKLEVEVISSTTDVGEIECVKCIDAETAMHDNDLHKEVNKPVSSKDIQLDPNQVKELSLEEGMLMINERIKNEPIEYEWANQTESNINKIFRDSNNFDILSETNLDYIDSECRATVCSVNFIPTQALDRMGRMRQLLSLTSFFEQDQELDDAQMYTDYTDDGRLIVKLLFK